MIQKNRYYRGSKISEAKFRQLIRCFALDLTASRTAKMTRLSIRSVNPIYLKLRHRLVWVCEQESPVQGVVEVDESYFGAQRVRGKRGRGALGKTIVFGLLKRHGKVYTEIVPECAQATLQAIIRGRVRPETVIHSDRWRGYDGLVDIGFDKHFRVNHSAHEFACGQHHINGMESFWSYAKRRLAKFNGVPKRTFYYHLKETEFRFNHRHLDLDPFLLKLLRDDPI